MKMNQTMSQNDIADSLFEGLTVAVESGTARPLDASPLVDDSRTGVRCVRTDVFGVALLIPGG
jgi:hypothetical protein